MRARQLALVIDDVERIPGGETGIRFSFHDITGITETELARLLDAQPYTSITDVYQRARPSRPLMMRLALIAYVRQLTARPHTATHEPQPDQVPLFGDDLFIDATIPDPSAEERIATDLQVLSTEVDGHIMDLYRPMLDDLGVTRACDLLSLRSDTQVLVAGVRVATQTPPMRSGKRTVFISLDDGTGCIDAAFFEEAQQQASTDLFSARMMTIRGRTRRTGDRGVSVQAEEARDLSRTWQDWQRARQ